MSNELDTGFIVPADFEISSELDAQFGIFYSSGGGETPISFTKTLIMDNFSISSDLTFSESYLNYPLLEFVTYNDDDNGQRHFITTSSMVEAFFQYSTYICLNEYNTNHYVTYTKQSSTAWTRGNRRYLDCIAVYGITPSKEITIDTLYNRENYGSSNVTFITTNSLFAYDIIVISTCTSSNDETLPCEFLVFPTSFESALTDKVLWIANKYNSGTRRFFYAHTVDPYQYFVVQGIKFN